MPIASNAVSEYKDIMDEVIYALLRVFTFICAAITQKIIIMNSYEAQMGILAKR